MTSSSGFSKVSEHDNMISKSDRREVDRWVANIAHDLRSPLMSIRGCVELLSEQCREKLDASDCEILDALKGSIHHMQSLLEDPPARFKSKVCPKPACDASVVIRNVVELLAPLIDANRAIVTKEPMPIVVASETQLGRLFQNLLENSLKYKGQHTPRIHIGIDAAPAEWVFFVKDNGMGIEPCYFKSIFRSESRTPRARSESGHGLGLAICHGIVQELGGRMWVESKVGKGSTFFFSLPRRTQEAIDASLPPMEE